MRSDPFVFSTSCKPHCVRSSHIARFSSVVCSTVVEGAIPTDIAGGTAGSDWGGCIGKGGAGWVGGTGWPVRRATRRGGELGRVALGSQGMVIGDRVEERDRPPRLPVCKAVVGTEGDEDEACCCVLGDIGLGIVADEVDDCGSCRLLFGLTSVKLDVCGSRLDLEFRGDSVCSGTLEEKLSRRLEEGKGDPERERERLCLVYPGSRRDRGPYFGDGEDFVCFLFF